MNLTPLAHAGDVVHLTLVAPNAGASDAHATVSVNAIGPVDLMEAAVSGLTPGQAYTLWLASSRSATSGERQALVTFNANIAGAQVAQAIAPLRQALIPAGGDRLPGGDRRFLMITESESNLPVLIQSEIQP
jgi:hypothetical protein